MAAPLSQPLCGSHSTCQSLTLSNVTKPGGNGAFVCLECLKEQIDPLLVLRWVFGAAGRCVWDWVTVNRYVCVHRNAEHQRQGFFKIYVLGLGHPRNRRIQTLLVWVFQWDFLVKMCNKENDQTCPWNCRNILFLMFILQRMRSFFLGNQHRGKHLRDLEGTSGLRVFLINTTHVSPFQSSLAPLLLISSDAV